MTNDYREILRNEFEQRCKRNPSYSLRAFAKAISIAAPQLSAILKGKKGLSSQSASRISEALRWSADEKNYFVTLVEMNHSRKKREKVHAEQRLQVLQANKSFATMKMDEFKMISDWYHLAILQVFELDDFRSHSAWIAQRLGISNAEAKSALKRLHQLGFISGQEGQWKLSKKNIATPAMPSSAIRNYHHQMLKKAGEALDHQTIDERDFSSIVMPIDQAQLAEAKEWIKEFRRRFFANTEKTKNKDSIYCLSVQFFKISNEISPSTTRR